MTFHFLEGHGLLSGTEMTSVEGRLPSCAAKDGAGATQMRLDAVIAWRRTRIRFGLPATEHFTELTVGGVHRVDAR